MTSLLAPSTINAMKPKVRLEPIYLSSVSQYLPTEREICLNFESVSKNAQKAVRLYGYSDVWYDLCFRLNKTKDIGRKSLGTSLKKAENLEFISKYINSIRSSIKIIPLKSNVDIHNLQKEFRDFSKCFGCAGGRFYFICPRSLRVGNIEDKNNPGQCKSKHDKNKRMRLAEEARKVAFKLYETGCVDQDLDIPDMDIVKLLDYESLFLSLSFMVR